jgi:hypothetical protein
MILGGYVLVVAAYLTLAYRAAKRRECRAFEARTSGALVYESWALLPDAGQVQAFSVEPTLPRRRSAEQWSGGYRTASV